jgi:formylglycine-generating enzyme required for sulfatase activity
MKYAWCPPGTFLMGGTANDEEKPVHRVRLTKGFYMCAHPVTQAQWQAVMGYNPSHFRGDDRPVEQVSWNDCQEFCSTLRELTGKPIRLPTEAEWEYACRAGTTADYYTGPDEAALRKAGWFDGNSNKQTQPVGKLAANAWNLFDMHGNVWECCQDWKAAYEVTDPAKDPTGPSSGDARVLRGGSWLCQAEYCRAAIRHRVGPGRRDGTVGCRVCFCLD